MPRKGERMSDEQRAKIAAALTKGEPVSKRCSRCGDTKPASAYGRRSANPAWLRAMCRECERAYSRSWDQANPEGRRRANARQALRAKGLSEAEHEALVLLQDGRCAICGHDAGDRTRRLFVDHCHTSGRVRGLLCGRCNSGLGMFLDDAKLLGRAIAYLGGTDGAGDMA